MYIRCIWSSGRKANGYEVKRVRDGLLREPRWRAAHLIDRMAG
jgi:hypothetical protein